MGKYTVNVRCSRCDKIKESGAAGWSGWHESFSSCGNCGGRSFYEVSERLVFLGKWYLPWTWCNSKWVK